MSTMLRTENLTYSYPASEENEQPTLALDGVTLAIERGSFTVILGHNGSGKSTLAKTFNAVLLPSGGRVYVDGMDTVDETLLLEIRRRVGMVFQNPDNQIVANVVEEDVAFAPENLGVPTKEIRRRVDDALRTDGIEQSTRRSCSPADRSSVSPSRACWRCARSASCSTRRPPCSTPSAAARSFRPSNGSTATRASPLCSSPTT